MQLLGIIAAIVFLLFAFTNFFGNTWNSLVNARYVIPDETSLLDFKPIEMTNGSESTWIFAEDSDNYYHYDYKARSYIFIPKEKIEGCQDFMLSNVATWCKKEDNYKKAIPKKTEAEIEQELDDEYADPWQ